MPSKSRSDPAGRWNQRSKAAVSTKGLSWTGARAIDGRSSSRCGASAKLLARPAAMQRERLERAHAGCLAEGFARRELATSGPWALLGAGLALSVMTDRLTQRSRHAEVLVWEIRSLDHEQRAIFDAAGRGVRAATVRIASAGHLPALLADGRAEYLEPPSGPPLGGVSREPEKMRSRGIVRRRRG